MTTDLEQRVRRALDEDASKAPRVGRAREGLRRRVRRRQAGTAAATVAGLAAVVALALAVVQLTDGDDRFTPTPAEKNIRPVFERTATIEGFTVTAPSDWYLVDYWPVMLRAGEITEGAGRGEAAPGSEWIPGAAGVPVLQLTNHDPGLGAPICGSPTGEDPFPVDAVGLYVGFDVAAMRLQDPGAGLAVWPDTAPVEGTGCQGGTSVRFGVRRGDAVLPYLLWYGAGPNASDEDRARLDAIVASLQVDAEQPGLSLPGTDTPGFVLFAGTDEDGSTWTIEARPTDVNVDLKRVTRNPNGTYSEGGVADFGVPPLDVEGGMMGVVVEEAERVEFRPANGGDPAVALLADLPASLGYEADAYWFPEGYPTEDEPAGGEVVAVLPRQEPEQDALTLPTGDVADVIGYGVAAGNHEYRIVMLTGGTLAATSPIGVVGRVEIRPVEGGGPWEVVDVHPFVRPEDTLVEFDGVAFGRDEGQGYDSLIVYGLAYEPVGTVNLEETGGENAHGRDVLRPFEGAPTSVVGAFTQNQTLDEQWRIEAITGESTATIDIDHGDATELIDPSVVTTMEPTGDVEVGGVTYRLYRWAGRGVGSDARCIALRSGSEILAVRCISDLVARDLPIAWHVDLPEFGGVVFGTTPGDSGWIEGDGTMVAEIRGATFVGFMEDACAKPFIVVSDDEFQVPAAYDCPLSDSRPQ